ncbi:MAG: DUF1156 domain-containing protein [Chloroflexota bacterium]|nr:DUF1156 domain-containing protein [Chloroflexota bacterium]
MTDTTPRKKLIEVALPLEAINVASAREKSIRHGHPSTLHLWWARRPLATCRAVLFASLVDDPCSDRNLSEEQATAKRQELFGIIEDLVKWENSNNPEVLGRARAAIMESTGGNPPPVLDPFCGGGSIPLEAQRLGLEAHGSDLNPVAVLLTKALIEIPPKFAGRPPVNPESRRGTGCGGSWPRATGLAADVRYYGQWMRDEAEKRIGHLYPKAKLPPELGGGEATVIAWLWARTVICPNPACRAEMPLVRSFTLTGKPNRKAWIKPCIDRSTGAIQFQVCNGDGTAPIGTVNRKGARCFVCNAAVPFSYLRNEGRERRLNNRLMAIVAEGPRRRYYLSPSADHEFAAQPPAPDLGPQDAAITHWPGRTNIVEYGMTKWTDLFTPRQLTTLSVLSNLLSDVFEKVSSDSATAGVVGEIADRSQHGMDASSYADPVVTYLAFALDRLAMTGNSLVRWNGVGEKAQHAFGRQALPMLWDFAEPNFFAEATGSIAAAVELAADPLALLGGTPGHARQGDASQEIASLSRPLICTDPPYYDNIDYAGLSDFFYVWLRRSLLPVYPELFGTLLTPKGQELVANPYRFDGDREQAREFFEAGLGQVFAQMRVAHHSDYPLAIFYAFKQAESVDDEDNESDRMMGVVSTGWETMLEGLLGAGFSITGTWPMRTEMGSRMIGQGSNALASSIVLVCRPRPENAPFATRSEFARALKRELPGALRMLQQGNIAPVDLAQAAIGPGMAIYSRYSKVLEPNGEPLRVRAALGLINQALDDVLAEQDAEYDADTRWAVAWFEQHGLTDGSYGDAETLSKAKNSSVAGLQEAGILTARAGKVALLRRDQLPEEWDPRTDRRPTVWEVTQHLIRALDREGEGGAARLLARAGARGEIAKDLAYRLYVVSERKGRAQEALAYNSLVVAWPSIAAKAAEQPAEAQQGRLV